MSDLVWLDPNNFEFPPTSQALTDPDGLLAVGGDLSTARLITAYRLGIFPWFDDTQPILWWSPNPRMVLNPNHIYFNRSLKKLANKKRFTVTIDNAFERVIAQCSNSDNRSGDKNGTWITDDMLDAYIDLHHEGIAHSVEVWQDEQLVGGLYGVSINRVFFGESMFSLVSGASKIGFSALAVQLSQWGFLAIDCQVQTDYLASFGAQNIDRSQFEEILTQSNKQTAPPSCWKQNWHMPSYGIAFKEGKLDLNEGDACQS